ncbi:hypothetical protein LTR01_000862 [Friedmanniomyces endolithicus]|nr:hypothetical protein LTR01_000862 [Friedmanniomyces endolithicus]KAK0835921.1 hypothetical protein LTR73_000422 [Friedmanniomyces endolithicus]
MAFRFLDLPYELRQNVLCLALKQVGVLELQHPIWAGEDVYRPALFSVCRLLRREALQAFYEVNLFLWTIDMSAHHRSDPADYPSLRPNEGKDQRSGNLGTDDLAVLPAVPWMYPYLWLHLRHLNVDIYLPPKPTAEWYVEFPRAFQRLVEALDCGRRLDKLQMFFHACYARPIEHPSLAGEQLRALKVLTGFEVRGRVGVSTLSLSREAQKALEDLGKRMKSTSQGLEWQ